MACTQGGGAPAISAGDGTVTAPVKRVWQPTDLWLLGIVLAIINFWLFAQTRLNVIPGIRASLGVDPTVANLGLGDGAHVRGCSSSCSAAWPTVQSGLLTLGHLVAILATIPR